MRHVSHEDQSAAEGLTGIILDGTKIQWHQDRLQAWERGERFAPITVDMSLTRACQYACVFCYALMQENGRRSITSDVMERFLVDAADLGVRGVSLVSDGESTLSPAYEYTIRRGAELGISMASGTNGYLSTRDVAERILPSLTYLRINFDAGNPAAYTRIMGVPEEFYHRVVQNIRDMMEIKHRDSLSVTIGMQMVLLPQYGEEIMPLARLAVELGVDYLVLKHCSDDEEGSLGVEYARYQEWYDVLREAEELSNGTTQISAKWNKITVQGKRDYARCYGAPFLLQLSGSGPVAPCGMLFNDRYRKFHIGNIVTESFKDIVMGDRYWEVMGYLASDRFDARRMCGSLCIQDLPNRVLDRHRKGQMNLLEPPKGPKPQHINFI